LTVVALVLGGHDLGDNVAVAAPAPGLWRPSVARGQLVRPGDVIGHLEVLGQPQKVIAPEGAFGAVVAMPSAHGERGATGPLPVGYGTRLYLLDPAASIGGAEARAAAAKAHAAEGQVFTAPTSGRLYWKPGPGKPAFVRAGDVLRDGQTVCLLEVMKTFNRVTYAAAAGLPARARVTAILPREEEDLASGAPILRLEPA